MSVPNVWLIREFQFTRPRGARLIYKMLNNRMLNFNSRAHEGRDSCGLFHADFVVHFNSRAHEGRDPGGKLTFNYEEDFNSRAHEGRDYKFFNSHLLAAISIHAPTRGATLQAA